MIRVASDSMEPTQRHRDRQRDPGQVFMSAPSDGIARDRPSSTMGTLDSRIESAPSDGLPTQLRSHWRISGDR